jgi:thiamine biosynthesis lipoprotein ApbE
MPALQRLRQEDGKFHVSLGNIVRLYLKQQQQQKSPQPQTIKKALNMQEAINLTLSHMELLSNKLNLI